MFETYLGFTVRPEQRMFLELLADHGVDPRTACKQLGHKLSLVQTWRKDKETPEFRDAYHAALELYALHRSSDATEALEAAREEIKALTGDNIKKAAAFANIGRSIADQHRWTAGKWDPDRFGERVQVHNKTQIEAVVLLPALMAPTQQATATLLPEPEPTYAIPERIQDGLGDGGRDPVHGDPDPVHAG